MTKLITRVSLIIITLIACFGCKKADVTMPVIFSDGMVLQQNVSLPVWGTTEPGRKVSVIWQGKKYSAKADKDGKFTVNLDSTPAGGPYTLQVNDHLINDVLVGKVFLCSGQSNMELPIRRCMDVVADEVKDYVNPNIRYVKTPLSYDFETERDDISPVEWAKIEKPEDAQGWGALCYFVARYMQESENIPIGIINSSVGGTPIEAWMTESSLDQTTLQALYECRQPGYVDSLKIESGKVYSEWQKAHNELPAAKPTPWKKVALFNNSWAKDSKGQNIYGSHLFRNSFTLSKDQAKGDATLHLGAMIDADSVFVNGVFVGNTTYRYPPRHYSVPEGTLKEGVNTIEIHLYSYHEFTAGFVKDKKYSLETPNSEVSLLDGWEYRLGKRMPERDTEIFLQYRPVGLYNAMIAPFINYPREAVIWYQGEANCDNAEQYGDHLMTMIKSWREEMHQSDLPFYVVELASYEQASWTDQDHGWTRVQKEQARACENTENAYFIPNADQGEWYDIHPQDKITIAKRVVEAIQKNEK